MDVGLRIKNRRKALNMTVEQLADSLGKNKATVYRYESGDVENITRQTLIDISKALKCSPAYLMGWQDNPVDTEPLFTQRLPILGDIACGQPITANEEHEFYAAGSGIKADFALRCKGDSMINARIYDGDIVFIQATPIVDNGTIAAVLVNDEVTLKRVYQSTNEIRLVAENPIYPTMTYFGEELDHVKILGRVVAFQAKI